MSFISSSCTSHPPLMGVLLRSNHLTAPYFRSLDHIHIHLVHQGTENVRIDTTRDNSLFNGKIKDVFLEMKHKSKKKVERIAFLALFNKTKQITLRI